jgi:hypothetical protein
MGHAPAEAAALASDAEGAAGDRGLVEGHGDRHLVLLEVRRQHVLDLFHVKVRVRVSERGRESQ